MTTQIKIFGIGLNKTGTTSLRCALRHLGYDHLDRKPRLFKLWKNGQIPQILKVADQHESFDDWPWPLIVPQLLDRYGENARFILTMRRSPLVWLDSLKAHSERTNPFRHPRTAIYGHPYPHGCEDQHLAFYNLHRNRVRQLFTDRGLDHLLLEVCWDGGDGWRELCRFLGKPSPDIAFPHANARENMKADPEHIADNKFLIAQQLVRLARDSDDRRLSA